MFLINDDEHEIDELCHIGVKRRSGRYPWGSGEDPYQHDSFTFLSRYDDLRKSGMSDKEIAESLGISQNELRTQKSNAKLEVHMAQAERARSLQEDGHSLRDIAQIMGFNSDSSVRNLLNDSRKERMSKSIELKNILKDELDKKGMLDVGSGVAQQLGYTDGQMTKAIQSLEDEGYHIYGGRAPQVTNPGKFTTLKVLTTPEHEHKDIFEYDQIGSVDKFTPDPDYKHPQKMVYPASMDSKRVAIKYAEEGGVEKDGVVEIRRGCADLDLGGSNYAQVRILVNGTHYIKGMAVYSDGKDMPDGCDVLFNTNKSVGTPLEKVLKPIHTEDPENPFGSAIKPNGQSYYIGKDGKEHLSLINKRADEGDWEQWSNKLPSQFLAKQDISLVKRQLGISKEEKLKEYNDICALTNPVVKKNMLKTFSDDCDSAAVHLKAAALPRQKYQVILPVTSMKENEVYAPNFRDGEKIALVRFPHGGRFEIPILTVNNKNKEAQKTIGKTPKDAVGICQKVADRLSGADFDGDCVMCIPTGGSNGINIKNQSPLKGLEGFDTKRAYPYVEGMKVMSKKNTQKQMGVISNLITDMTIKGANEEELAAAVRHSMVVIDAAKHKLNYVQSEKDNNIAYLRKKYQGHYDENGTYREGASTLLSSAQKQVSVTKRAGTPKIDPNTGKYIYKESADLYYADRTKDKNTGLVTIKTTDGKKITYDPTDKEAYAKYNPVKKVDSETGTVTFTNKDGTITYATKVRTQKSTAMAETDDARKLSSGSEVENEYANYANFMKALGNQARKELISTKNPTLNKEAAKTYSKEVASLNAALSEAKKNAPRERQAQLIANSEIAAKKKDNPAFAEDNDAVKKAATRALVNARARVGAKRTTINISDKEWEAIQAGAISATKLSDILNHTDSDHIRKLATPKEGVQLSTFKQNKIKAMKANGYTNAQIADAVGISTSTVIEYAS